MNELVLSRFGNGQFAVLVLVLTMADLLTILVGLVGGLTLEVVAMSFLTKSVSKDFITFFPGWPHGLGGGLLGLPALLLPLLLVNL